MISAVTADNHGKPAMAECNERFLTFAFGNRIALTVDSVNIEATDASALPTHSRSSYLPSVERLFRGDPIMYM